MKEKCVQNAISLFIGLLTTMMTRLLRLNSIMNLPRGGIFVSLARASDYGPEEKRGKRWSISTSIRINYELCLSNIADNYAVI
jgi:hypothetical protein